MIKDLIGFTVKARVEAKCPKGHRLSVPLTVLIEPTDEFVPEKYTATLSHYLSDAYKMLSEHDCEDCKKNSLTKWFST